MNFKKAGDKNWARDHNQMIREIKRLQSKVSDSVWSHPFVSNRVQCPLGDMLVDTANTGKFKIRSGYVHGGGTSALVGKDNLTATIGDKVFLKIGWTADESNGVLLGSGTMTSQVIEQNATLPTDDEITVSSLSGFHYRVLGEWIDDGSGGEEAGNPQWVKDACGSYAFTFCGGLFSGDRGAPSVD